MSTHLLVDKLVQDWTEMWTPMSDHACASRCDEKQLFQDVTVVVAILHVMSSIDCTNLNISSYKPFRQKVTNL